MNSGSSQNDKTLWHYSGKFPAWLVHLAAIVCVSMWGFSFVSTKVLLNAGMGTVEVYVYRFVIAYILLLLISHNRIFSHSWRDEFLFVICGVCSGSLYFITENTALKYTLTTNVSLLTSLSPLITAMLAGFLYKNEKPGRGIVIGSLVAFVGVGMVVFNGSTSGLKINPLGDVLSLAAAFCWSIYSLVLRRLSSNYDVFFITRKTFIYGLITSIPFLLMEKHLCNPIEVLSDPVVLFNVCFLAIGASLIAFLLWSVTVKYLGAVVANNYMYFQSIVTMIASFIVLAEPITVMGVLGCFTILFGLWFGDWITRRNNMRLHR